MSRILGPQYKGNIYMVDLSNYVSEDSEIKGPHPVVVIDEKLMNNEMVQVVPISSYTNNGLIPSIHVLLRAGNGVMAVDSLVLIDKFMKIKKSDL